jgi:uncharacterized membrane protein YfcA
MNELFTFYSITPAEWVMTVIACMAIGGAKSGLAGLAMFSIPVMAGIFGGRASAGLVLPILCVGDVFAVIHYHHHTGWNHIRRLSPWVLSGIIIGLFVGKNVSDSQFTLLIGIILLVGVAIMAIREARHGYIPVPDNRWFPAVIGIAAGFSTMIGNSAGPVMAIYLLSMKLPKDGIIGTAAWFFMIVNLFKVPLHVIFWGTITPATLMFDAVMIPAVALGAFIAVRLVKLIPERPYRIFIIVVITLAALKLVLPV